jgi:BirA family biotin operon repressor/biotin-[acetyl-CoA-carboxylase] ligase
MPLALFPGAPLDPLAPEQVRAGRPTVHFGWAVLHFPTVGSTNDLARAQASAGMAEGLLVLAEEQTAGRGRYARRWEAPCGSSVLASLLLRPTFLPPERAFLLTALAALAIAEAVTRQTGLAVELKWPNDVLVAGRKVCGVLVELEGTAARLEWAVLGWGLNVNVDFSADPELGARATSLAAAAGRPFPRLPLLLACLARLETHYETLRAGRGEEVWDGWRARLGMLGREVSVSAPEGTFGGRALDVALDGALLVQRDDGRVERVLAGDVVPQVGGSTA